MRAINNRLKSEVSYGKLTVMLPQKFDCAPHVTAYPAPTLELCHQNLGSVDDVGGHWPDGG